MPEKSTVEQIRQRFDNDVERFSSLETGQTTTVDASLALDLIATAAAITTPDARRVLDIGCGAGNYTLKLLQSLPDLDVILVDLSRPMLDRAVQRVGDVTSGEVVTHQADIRELPLEEDSCDIILAAAVFHHLRGDQEWRDVFAKCYRALRPGGSIWISDLIEHATPGVQALMWTRYGEYLTSLRDEAYRDFAFGYIEQEDTPRSLLFQVDLLRAVGFDTVEILHKNSCFAAFGAVKDAP
jgi:tRNA (cmo5U34)-methyltransferase